MHLRREGQVMAVILSHFYLLMVAAGYRRGAPLPIDWRRGCMGVMVMQQLKDASGSGDYYVGEEGTLTLA
jgi:hypothetical protein